MKYDQSMGQHHQEGSSPWKPCFSYMPRDSKDCSISSLPACAMVETSSPVYLPSNFMVRFDQSSVWKQHCGTLPLRSSKFWHRPKPQRASLCQMIKISSLQPRAVWNSICKQDEN